MLVYSFIYLLNSILESMVGCDKDFIKETSAYNGRRKESAMSNELDLHEADYRRGYYQGYIQAIEDFQALTKQGFSAGRSVKIAMDFALTDLKEWRAGELSVRIAPPNIKASA